LTHHGKVLLYQEGGVREEEPFAEGQDELTRSYKRPRGGQIGGKRLISTHQVKKRVVYGGRGALFWKTRVAPNSDWNCSKGEGNQDRGGGKPTRTSKKRKEYKRRQKELKD